MHKRLLLPVLLALILLGIPTPARAHAQIVSTTPSNGEMLPTAPAEITIFYSMGVQIADITVLDSSGGIVSDPPIIDAADWKIVHIPLQPLGEGVYTIVWEALAEDGHFTDGSFFFIVGQAVVDRAQFTAMLSNEDTLKINPAEPILRALLFLGLILTLGAPLTALLILEPAFRGEAPPGGDAPPHTDRPERRLLLTGSVLSALGALGLVTSQLITAFGTPGWLDILNFLQTTPSGGILLTRLIPALGLILILAITRAPQTWRAAALPAGAVALYSLSWNSHTAAMFGSPSLLADALHLLGASLWGGGLVALAVLLPPRLQRLPSAAAGRAAAAVIRRFSTLAIFALACAVTSGLLLTGYHFVGWGDFLNTLYGLGVSGKLILMALAIGLGGLHRFGVLRRLKTAADPARHVTGFTRSVRLELAFVIGIFALAGLITSAPPPHIVAAAEAAARPKTYPGDPPGGTVQLDILPVQVGLNLFEAALTKDGAPVPAEKVVNPVLLMRQPDAEVELPQIPLESAGDGKFAALTSFTMPGTWRVRFGGMVDGKFTTQTFLVEVTAEGAPAPVDHTQHLNGDTPGPSFNDWMRRGVWLVLALSIAGLGWEFWDHTRQRRAAS